jgi:hypothetical protein
VVWLERAKIEEEPLSILKIFHSSFGTEIVTFLPIAARQFCLLSYWLTAGIWAFPSAFLIHFKNCPEAFQKPLGISQWLSYTLLAVSSGCSTDFKSISQWLLAKTWQFSTLFSEGLRFCYCSG